MIFVDDEYSLPKKAENGEVAVVGAETKKGYIYKDDTGWESLNVPLQEEKLLDMSLYDINKAIIEQLGEPNPRKLKGIIKKVKKDLEEKEPDKQNYYLLYGKDIGYFTLFHRVQKENETINLIDNCVDMLHDLGAKIYDIFYIKDENVTEFWIKYEDEMHCLYLMGWDLGLVEFNE